MIFQCDGGPGGRRSQDQQDESYSEEEEEASSTSVETEGEDEEEEEEEDEGESEEDDTEDSEDKSEGEEEEAIKQKPTRSTGPMPSSCKRPNEDSQRGRLTRQKAREEMPTKRLLRSRKKSPAAGAGSRVPQVFKCPNCKKEFNNRVSLSRHTGWCKQKVTKAGSPRKKKSEDGVSKNELSNQMEIAQSRIPNNFMMETPLPSSAPRGRGRPRKNQVPLTSKTPKPAQQQQIIVQRQHYQEDMMLGVGAPVASSSSTVDEEFIQQKSPQSSPGVMDTSSEEDYEQKEFAANAHQLISHRNSSVSIDVVNPDPPPEQVEGPVTCPQCKMTYRTLLGFQNHIPNCSPLSSDEEGEEEEEAEVDVVDQHDEVPRFQQANGPNWTAHHTMPETLIAPPSQHSQPCVIDVAEDESTSSSDGGEVVSGDQTAQINSEEVPLLPLQSAQLPLQRYHEISISSTGTGKHPLKFFLPPDNTPQVINASGLTLERLGNSPIPKIMTANSPAAASPIQLRSPTPTSHDDICTTSPHPSAQSLSPLPPPPVYHPPVVPHALNNISVSSHLPPSPLVYPNTQQYSHIPPTAQPVLSHIHPPTAAPIPTPLPTSPSKTGMCAPTTSQVSLPVNPPVHAGGNPPTYTQAQLMPGTVLHNSMMPVPQQMTSTGESYHLHQPVSSQSLQQFPGSHFPVCYTTQAAPAPQSTYRVQNSVPGMHTTPPGLPPHSGIFVGGTNIQSQHQLQMTLQGQTMRHAVPDLQRLQTSSSPQLTQFPQQLTTIPGQPLSTSQIQGGIPIPGQQHSVSVNANNSGIAPYGIANPHQQPTFSMPFGTQLQQSNSQLPSNNVMSFPQMVLQQQQLNGLHPQQLQSSPQQAVPGPTHPNSAGSTPQQVQSLQQIQHQLPQQYQQYFQNSHSNLPKLPDNLGQSPQILQQQQQTVFNVNGQQGVPSQQIGLPLQMQHLQQQRAPVQTQQTPQPNQLLQQQSLPQQSIFQQTVMNPAAASSSNFVQEFNAQTQQATDNRSSIPGALAQPQQQSELQITQPMASHNSTNQNISPQQGQMELNLQQQVQLQQQQQQFLALQQQMQIPPAGDPNRAPSQQQSQFPQQTMQAVMVNGSLQWIKTGQPSQQIQVQMPQQQQQQQNSSTETGAPPLATQQPQQAGPVSTMQQPLQQQQQSHPQVIQHLAQVTDNAGNTYIIIAPQQQSVAQNGLGANAVTGNNTAQLLSLVPGLQGLPCQQQQQVQRANNSSPLVHCTANGVANHSLGSSSSGHTFSSVGRSAPCPCATCKEKTGTAVALDKYKKVLPYPSANAPHLQPQLKAISPKPPISIRPALPKQPAKIVGVQAVATSRSAPMQLAFTQNPNPQQSQPGSQLKLMPSQQPIGLVGVSVGGGTAPMSSPNIAVVRPMDPLQRLSDQISQIESTFHRSTPPMTSVTPPIAPSSTIIAHASPPQGPHLTLVTASPPLPPSSSSPHSSVSSTPPYHQISHVITLEPPPIAENPAQVDMTEDSVLNMPMPRLTLVDHGTPPPRHPLSSIASPASSPKLSSPGSSIQSISAPSTPVAKSTPRTTRVKRKVLQVSPSSGGEPEAKTIKLQLHKNNDSDSYAIKNIEINSAKVAGTYRSLMVKAVSRSKFTSAQEGKATNVVVVPIINLQLNPDPDTNEGNLTIVEDENGSNGGENSVINQNGGDNNNNSNNNIGSRTRLHSYRAVVVWEVQMDKQVLFKSSDVRDVWDRVFQIAQGARLNHNLPPVSYPATNIALPQDQIAAKAMFNELGLTHKAVQFLLDELPVLQRLSKKVPIDEPLLSSPLPVADGDPFSCNSTESRLEEGEQQHQNNVNDCEETAVEEPDQGNESGCARFERFAGRKSFDMFGWLTSKHRDPPTECDAAMESLKFLSAPIGMRYRKLKDKAREYLVIKTSEIHGRGLFTKRDIEKGEMIIEYAGEVIRPLVCDIREKYYESKAIGCYMFRINDHVIDATMKGNAARFINHSCEPNCEARAVKIFGKDHIIIFSLRRIGHGEELTYDYSFEKEDEKIICTCKSKYCRKYLN